MHVSGIQLEDLFTAINLYFLALLGLQLIRYVCSRVKGSKHLQIVIQVDPGKPGSEVSKGEKTTSQRKNLPIECAQGDQPVRCPNRGFCVHQSSAVPFGGGVFVVAGVFPCVVRPGEM